jgi:hypothetical protein
MNEELTNKQKKQLSAEEFKRKYSRWWLLYWGLFFLASLSFLCGIILPFMRDDITVQLTWATAFVSMYYAFGFLSVGEGSFKFWFDKVTDSDPDNNGQKIIAGIMLLVSGAISLSTAIATANIIAWWIGVFDTVVRIPPWAQKYIMLVIPIGIVANIAAAVLFRWVSDEAYSERQTNATIREAKNNALQTQAQARADFIAANAPILAQQMGEIEAQEQLDALQAQINQKRKTRGQSPIVMSTQYGQTTEQPKLTDRIRHNGNP